MIGADERYVLLTTFRRDGTPVATPVWWVSLQDGSFGFSTSSASGKAKRLAHTQRVTVQPCDRRGVVKPGTKPSDALGRLVTGAELAAIRERLMAKYGVMVRVISLFERIARLVRGRQVPYADRGVVITF